MEMITNDDLLEGFRRALEEELESTGLADWSINSAGKNFKDTFVRLSSQDLEDLMEQIREGLTLKIEVDLTDTIYQALDSIRVDRNRMSDDDYIDEEDV